MPAIVFSVRDFPAPDPPNSIDISPDFMSQLFVSRKSPIFDSTQPEALILVPPRSWIFGQAL